MAQPSYVLACIPSAETPVQPQISCGSVDGVPLYATALEGHFLTSEQYQALQEASQPFDKVVGAGYFSFGLGVVVACWLLAHSAGLVIQSVRKF